MCHQACYDISGNDSIGAACTADQLRDILRVQHQAGTGYAAPAFMQDWLVCHETRRSRGLQCGHNAALTSWFLLLGVALFSWAA